MFSSLHCTDLSMFMLVFIAYYRNLLFFLRISPNFRYMLFVQYSMLHELFLPANRAILNLSMAPFFHSFRIFSL